MRAKESGQSPLLLLDVIDVLNNEKVPYAVIGAMAVASYGVVRSSLDADAIIQIGNDAKRRERLRGLLTEAGLHVVIKKGGFDDPLLGVILIEDQHGNRVDLLLGIRKADNDLFNRITRVEFQGEMINMVGVEDLIAMKVYAGSSKDLADVEGILAVSEEMIDRKKLMRITGSFGEEAVKTFKKMM